MSKNSERYEWYTQDPREFRRNLWKWLFDGSKGGEVGCILAKIIRRHESQVRKRLENTSRVTKGVVVVLIISSIGVFLKKDNQASVAEIVFDNLESIALGSAGVIFLLEIPDRRKQSHVAAWQAINLAQGQVASGDRIQALQDLNKDNVDLSRIAVPGADLSCIDLSFANLMEANFEKTRFISANLEGANLERANLREAELNLANLQKACLRWTVLQKATLFQTNLREADLNGARLEGVQGEMVHLGKS